MEDPKKRKSVVELVREKFTQIVDKATTKRSKVDATTATVVVDLLQADYMPLEEVRVCACCDGTPNDTDTLH